jgi:transcriptional regulator with XRE-family HTH domain
MIEMPLLTNFRDNLRSAMDEHGMDQQDLAEKSGVHYVTISRILTGKQDPTVTVCEKLAKAAGLRPDLVFLTPEKIAS